MPGSTSSRRRTSPRRDRDRGDRTRDEERGRGDRAESRDIPDRRDAADVVPYETRGRDGRPNALRRRSTYDTGDRPDDESNDRAGRGRDQDKYYPPRSSHNTRRRGGGPPPPLPQQRRPRSESRGRPAEKDNARKCSDSRAAGAGHNNEKKKRNEAIQAALVAGVLEAMRQRSEPGEWIGEKGFRVATAAVSAGLVDVGLDKDPNKHSVGNLIKSTVGGLLIDKMANGGRK